MGVYRKDIEKIKTEVFLKKTVMEDRFYTKFY